MQITELSRDKVYVVSVPEQHFAPDHCADIVNMFLEKHIDIVIIYSKAKLSVCDVTELDLNALKQMVEKLEKKYDSGTTSNKL